MSVRSVPRFTPLRYLSQREYSERNKSGVHLMKDRLYSARNLYRKDLYSHYGCVNAIEFSNDGEWLVSGGDDRRVLIWNVEKALHGNGSPISMKGEHGSNIFCLGFDNNRQKIFSAGNDEQVIVHDFSTGTTLEVFLHEEAVYGLSVDPLNDNVFASACEDGRILIWDIREPSSTEPFCLTACTSAFHAVMFNPVEPRLLSTANSKEGVSLWDIRAPKKNCLVKYSSNASSESCMSVRFNSWGTQILALRRRLPPVLYNIQSSKPACQFDHREYYNSCTMKSCCFAGDRDEFILSGSDDFNLYMWKIPDEGSQVSWVDEAHMVLKGHRSIVNQVRFNHSNFLLVSSGVEKIIKLWSPFPVPNATGGLNRNCPSVDKERKVYSHEEYISLILQSGQVMSHDYSQKSTLEDPRMMAFFDSLVQREIEGWNSDASFSSANAESWLVGGPDTVSVSEISSDSSSESDVGGIGGSGLSPLTVAYVTAITSGHSLGQGNSTDEIQNGEPASQDTDSAATNRISQLIAQKRQELQRKPRRVQRSRYRIRSQISLKRSESQPRVRIRMEPESSSETRSSDSSDDSQSCSQGTTTSRCEESRLSPDSPSNCNSKRCSRNCRSQIPDGSPDSDSDTTELDDFALRKRIEINKSASCPSCCQTKSKSASGLSLPSTSDTKTDSPASESWRTCMNDSGASDTESTNSITPTEPHGSSEGPPSGGDTGTPDSGIASNICDNGDVDVGAIGGNSSEVTAWTQFKRIRSRLQRACRNYRVRSSDKEQSE